MLFEKFDFANTSGLGGVLVVECPIGTEIISQRINPGSSKVFPLEIKDAQSIFILFDADGGSEHDDNTEFDFTGRSTPSMFIKSINCKYAATSLSGSIEIVGTVEGHLNFPAGR